MKKEVGKEHKIRRFCIITAIIAAVALIGAVASLSLFSTPMLFLSDACIGVGAVCGVLSSGVGINFAIHKAIAEKNKVTSTKTLKRISEADKDKTIELTKKQRVKLVKKYAKANLKLCKINGCPFVGKYFSLFDSDKPKLAEALNSRDNYKLLRSVTTSPRKIAKYSKKISKLDRIIAENASKSHVEQWTSSYSDFVNDTEVKDRRTEISCFSLDTVEKFKDLVKEQESTDKLGGLVCIKFAGGRYKQIYARVTDTTLLDDATSLLEKDILIYCAGKPREAYSRMFPITVTKLTLNQSAKQKEKQVPVQIDSLEELASEFSPEKPSESLER